MKAPQETDAAGVVVERSLEVIGNVRADEETAGLEADAMTVRTSLKETLRARQDARDLAILAAGVVNAARGRTNRELRTFGKKLAAELVTERQAGERDPLFQRIFKKATPGKYLPPAKDDRARELADLEKALAAAETPADIRKLAVRLLKAIATEHTALLAQARSDAAVTKAGEKQESLKRKTVAAVRAMSAAVQQKFADNPARAREVLGWSDPTRRKAVAPAIAAKTGTAEPAGGGSGAA